jgi:hypothetical protein
MWLLALLFYFAGINELIVKFLSFKLNIDVYEYLKNYSNDTRYSGLQLPFIIYTFFFGALSSFVYFYDKIKKVNKNEFEFETPIGKNKITFRLLTHGDELDIDRDIKALEKLNKDVSADITTRFRYMITSVDGSSDVASINKFINGFL